jgi:hypothetical protein
MNTEVCCWKANCGADIIHFTDINQLPSSNDEPNLVFLRMEVTVSYETTAQNLYTAGCSDPEYPLLKPKKIYICLLIRELYRLL